MKASPHPPLYEPYDKADLEAEEDGDDGFEQAHDDDGSKRAHDDRSGRGHGDSLSLSVCCTSFSPLTYKQEEMGPCTGG